MSSLDDFFAKKDKKSKKKKPNFLATNELYKTLEESTKLMSELMVSNPEQVRTSATQLDMASSRFSMEAGIPKDTGLRFTNDASKDDDDWCDFNEENRRQYTHSSQLAISQLGLNCPGLGTYGSDNAKVEKERQKDYGGDGLGVVGLGQQQMVDNSGLVSCPWQKSEPSNVNSEVAMEMNMMIEMTKTKPSSVLGNMKSISIEQTMEGPKKQIYIPPALRQSQMNSKSGNSNSRGSSSNSSKKSTQIPRGVRKGQAPDLNSSEYFPALSASKKRVK
ncbi:protein CDV3 homolog [Drosophila tropicalis]|uniref:protein CDV3 homolog n=1 Tax=Drosophila tropicalis TaxID=46794 RepID=UPI0035ABB78E